MEDQNKKKQISDADTHLADNASKKVTLGSPLQIGSLSLPTNIIYAPLAGCSDFPFRKIVSKFHKGLKYAEMCKTDALVRHDEGTFHMLSFDKSQRPIGAQLCGSNPKIAKDAARIIEDLGFDVIDLNCGCPVDKVTKDGSGSGLLKNPERIGDILSEMVSVVNIPVTVKIRAGWDEESIVAEQITKIAENAGAKAIAIHGRTRVQAYKGLSNWDHIKSAKNAAKNIKVIGNGDIFSGSDAKRMIEYTGCDAVLAARGTLGMPWIAEDIIRAGKGLPPLVFANEEYRDLLLDHMNFITEFETERRAVLSMRRVGCWYLKNGKGTKELRQQLNKLKTIKEMRSLILNHNWENALIHA